GAREAGAREAGAREVGACEVGAREVGAYELGVCEVGACEVGAREVGVCEAGALNYRLHHSLAQTGGRLACVERAPRVPVSDLDHRTATFPGMDSPIAQSGR